MYLSQDTIRMHDITYPQGIYRCSTLDRKMKFCENSCLSRISADKRFLIMYQHPTRIAHDRGLCEAVCGGKINNKFSHTQQSI